MSEFWDSPDFNVAEVCESFQLDLSCLVDGELDDKAAARAMVHLENCDDCRGFFEDTRQCVQLHLDMADPDRLMARLATLTGREIAREAKGIELVHRLSTVLYQLGKAYVLAGTNPDWTTRVFEEAVPVETTQTKGRGFVDGVVMSGQDDAGGVDWKHARGILNGQLKKIISPLDKGRRLLEEAISVDGSHEEAQLYLAFLDAFQGKTLKAFEAYRRVFHTALHENNRGHAAAQLGQLHGEEGNFRKALACFRWISISGLTRRDERFFVAHFNIGVLYARLEEQERALASFRRLLDQHPDRMADILQLFAESTPLQEAIEAHDGFAENLLATCPELFGGPSPVGGSAPGASHDDDEGGLTTGDQE
jgi:tetratricopeptide (TPR) repeat protein